MPLRTTAILFACLLGAAPAAADDTVRVDVDGAAAERPRIGLVLSGGGARGAAHAGILKLLEEYQVPVDYIAGTSIGAMVGGFYASGMSPEQIIEWLHVLDWQMAATDRPPRRALSFRRKQDDFTYAIRPQVGFRDGRFVLPRGFLSGHELGYRLRAATMHTARWSDFDSMPIPFRAVATDIERGEPVILDRGPLADAMLASMAVPGVVTPKEIDGRLLLDGGLTMNLPVSVVQGMGADIVIAVDVGTPLAGRDALQDVIDISAQVIYMLGRDGDQREIGLLGAGDLLVRPDLSGITAADFALMDEAVARGLATSPVIARRLRELSLDDTAWRAWRATQRHPAGEWPVIDFIDIDDSTAMDARLIRARITVPTGKPLSPSRLRRDIDMLYSIGDFELIDFRLVEREGVTGLAISTKPNELGPNYLRFGINIEDDFAGGSDYNLLFMHTRTQVNRLNAEWRNEFQIGETRHFTTSLYQPMSWRGDWFVEPRAGLLRTTFDLFEGGSQTAQYDLARDRFSVEAGWHWRNLGEARIGVFHEDIDAKPRIGEPGLPRFDERIAGYQWNLTVDQLDSWTFPAGGWYLDVRGRHFRDILGGERRFSRMSMNLVSASSLLGHDRIFWSVRSSARTGGVALPLYEQFPLGGFLTLSGLRRDELRGAYLFNARVAWYRRAWQLPAALGDAVYYGITHERGNTWADRDDARLGDLRWGSSVFAGADTRIGAIYLAFGRADNGDTTGYLFLQRSFN